LENSKLEAVLVKVFGKYLNSSLSPSNKYGGRGVDRSGIILYQFLGISSFSSSIFSIKLLHLLLMLLTHFYDKYLFKTLMRGHEVILIIDIVRFLKEKIIRYLE
jgi:hypothetical protein